jgi:hypothetical protein
VPTSTPLPATATSIPPTPTNPPRRYSVSFEADDTTLTSGDCTNLRWRVEGASTILLDDRTVEPEGKKEVCPDESTEYKLTLQFPDQARLEDRTIEITVEQNNNGNSNSNSNSNDNNSNSNSNNNSNDNN